MFSRCEKKNTIASVTIKLPKTTAQNHTHHQTYIGRIKLNVQDKEKDRPQNESLCLHGGTFIDLECIYI